MKAELRSKLVTLLRETGRAHHAASAAVNGADPDWPIWYADFLKKPIRERVGMDFHRSQLIYCLMDADMEHQVRAPDSDWPEYFADQLIECHAPSESPAEDKLALYHYDGCPFCGFVRSSIARLGIDVELRDIHQNSQYRQDLSTARGRATVPVLRITSPSGDERWMPESRDIVRYLETTFNRESR